MNAATKRVLIADAYDDAARLLGARLEGVSDYDTVATHDGPETMREAERRCPDAAIVDMDTARLDGLEAARSLRARFGEQRPLLIAITGHDADELNFSGLFDHVLKKPVDMRDLLPALAQA